MIGLFWYQTTVTPQQAVPPDLQPAVLQALARTFTAYGVSVTVTPEEALVFHHGIWHNITRQRHPFNFATAGRFRWNSQGDLAYRFTFIEWFVIEVCMGILALVFLPSVTLKIIFIGVMIPLYFFLNCRLAARWLRRVINESVNAVLQEASTAPPSFPPRQAFPDR